MYQWKMKELTIEYDFDDAIAMEKYEKAMVDVYEQCDAFSKRLKNEVVSRKEQIRVQCEIVHNCFKTMFDDKTVVALFEGRHNLKETIDIFDSFVSFALTSINESNNHINSVLEKYSGKKK